MFGGRFAFRGRLMNAPTTFPEEYHAQECKAFLQIKLPKGAYRGASPWAQGEVAERSEAGGDCRRRTAV